MTKPPHDLKGIAALLAKKGRGGDTMLAHINPQEAAILKAMGGSGTINPETGLPEFGWWDWNPFTEKGALGGLNPGSDTFIGNPVIETARNITGGTAEAIQNVASKLGTTVEAIASDPRKLAGVAIMVAFPGAAGAVGEFLLPEALTASLSASAAATTSAIVGQAAINTAINGGDVKAAITSALIQQGIPAVKAELAGALSGGEASTINNLIAKYGASIATDVGLAVIMKTDPIAALAFSGAKAATDLVMDQSNIKDQVDWGRLPKSVQDSVTAAITAKLTNRDPYTAVSNSLFNNAIDTARKEVNLQSRAVVAGLPTLSQSQLDAIPNLQSEAARDNVLALMGNAKETGYKPTIEQIQAFATAVDSNGNIDYAKRAQLFSQAEDQYATSLGFKDYNAYLNAGSLGTESDLGPQPTPSPPSAWTPPWASTPTVTGPILEGGDLGESGNVDTSGGSLGNESDLGTEPTGNTGWQGPRGPLTEEQTKRYTDEFSKYLDSLQDGATIPPNYGVQDLGITQENWQSFDQNLQQMLQEGRLPTQWKPGDNGAFTYTDDDGSTLTIDANGNITGYTEAPAGNLPGETPTGGPSTAGPSTGGTKPGTTPTTKPPTTPTTPTTPTIPTIPKPPTATAGGTSGMNLMGLLALLGAEGGGQSTAPTPPPTVDIGEQLDLEGALETNPFARKQTQPKMATGGSIDDLLAMLQQRG